MLYGMNKSKSSIVSYLYESLKVLSLCCSWATLELNKCESSETWKIYCMNETQALLLPSSFPKLLSQNESQALSSVQVMFDLSSDLDTDVDSSDLDTDLDWTTGLTVRRQFWGWWWNSKFVLGVVKISCRCVENLLNYDKPWALGQDLTTG